VGAGRPKRNFLGRQPSLVLERMVLRLDHESSSFFGRGIPTLASRQRGFGTIWPVKV
jgi:hypothetical protein